MQQAIIEKTADTAATAGQLEKINRYTRRTLTVDEVYIFSIVLCDNEVDRDGERFPQNSLEKLAELYLGKTGVFDHSPKAENQSARIFDTALEQTADATSAGESYCRLRAWAYMVRCPKNDDLILEIDGGIKKEVSVGCAVGGVLCSVCGEEQRGGGCVHRKGEDYGGKTCHHLLVDPTDAYEWSFVAVPAQPRAGVTKRRGGEAPPAETVPVQKARLERLEALAALGERREAELRADVIRLGLLSGRELDAGALEGIAAKLDIPQLEALRKSFAAAARQRIPLGLQLGRAEPEPAAEADREFRI